MRLKPNRKDINGNLTLERKWTMSKVKPKEMTREKSTQIENILNRRTVNLSGIQLTQSETNLLRKGLNFCPTPPPPGKYEISKDIDAFARRLTLKEYHTPENIEDVIDGPGYQPSILQKLNQKERKVYTGPSREPYLNTWLLMGDKEDAFSCNVL